jgi:uncharacterized protein YjeT (DUF2065 family)
MRGGFGMARTIGFVLGGVMLLEGILYLLRPRLVFRFWRKEAAEHAPTGLNKLVGQYYLLSNRAIRSLAVWEVASAGVLLWLSTKAKE